MSIASRIEQIEQHISDDYDVLELAGADLTNVDKNILNLKQSWEERLLYFLANGTDVVWNNWLPKVNGTGENITLNNTIQAKMDFVYKGNTSQESTTGKNLEPSTANSFSGSGMIFKKNNDGSWTLNGTNNTADTRFYRIADDFTLPAGTYTLSNSNSSVSDETVIFYDDNWNFNRVNINTKTFSEAKTIKPYIKWKSGVTLTNFTIYPMIEAGSSATPYEPYTGGNPAPNPDYPYPVQVVSGNNSIKVEGKNLFDLKSFLTTRNTTYTENSDGSFTFQTTPSDTNRNPFEFNVNQNVSLSGLVTNVTSSNFRIELLNENNQTVGEINQSTTEALNKNARKLRFNWGSGGSVTLKNIQLEISPTASTFTPYVSQTYPINLGSMELCKIGDYQDYIRKSTGKNLFDYENATIKYNYAKDDNGNETYSSETNYTTSYTPVLPNTTYTLSYKTTASVIRIYYYDNSKNWISRSVNIYSSSNNYTFTTPNNCYYLQFQNIINYSTNVMLNKGLTALPYEPYGKVWYKYGAIGKTKFGDLSWSYSSTNQYFLSEISNIFIESENGVLFKGLCDIYLPTTSAGNNSWANKTNYSIGVRPSSNYLCIKDTNYSNKDTFKEARKDNLTYYVLATPTYTKITDELLTYQLEQIKYSYSSQTNISQTNTDKPFILDVVALGELD